MATAVRIVLLLSLVRIDSLLAADESMIISRLGDLTFKQDVFAGLAVSPDGIQIAVAGSQDVRVFDSRGQVIHKIIDVTPSALAYAHNGKRLAIGDADGSIYSADIARGFELQKIGEQSNSVTAIRFVPNSNLMVSGGPEGRLYIWDVSLKKLIESHAAPGRVGKLDVAADGQVVVIGDYSGHMLWRRTNQDSVHSVSVSDVPTSSLTVAPCGTQFCTGGDDGIVRVWDTLNGHLQYSIKASEEEVTAVCFTPDSRRLTIGTGNGEIHIVDAVTHKHQRKWSAHSNCVDAIQFIAKGQVFASGAADGTVRLWNLNGASVAPKGDCAGRLYSCDYSHATKLVATAGIDRIIRIWSSENGERKSTLQGHSGAIHSVKFLADGHHLVSASSDGTIRLWNVSDVKEERRFDVENGKLYCLAVSDTGLIAASDEKVTLIWNMRGTQSPKKISCHADAVSDLSFARDGRAIYSSSEQLCLTHLADSKSRVILAPQVKWIEAFDVSENGKYVAIATDWLEWEKAIEVWNLSSAKRIYHYHAHQTANCVAIDTVGARVAWGGADGTVRIKILHDKSPIIELRGHDGTVNCLVFSKDGNRLISASADTTAIVWNVSASAQVDE